MYIGSIGYIISLGLVSAAFYFNWGGLSVPAFLFLFIASHAIGQGAVIWVFISEIFPNHIRASGQAFGSSVHWVLAAIIPSLIPVLFSTIGAEVVFLVFTIMMVFQLAFVAFLMPETKGRSLEELSEELTNNVTQQNDTKNLFPLTVSIALSLSAVFCNAQDTKSSEEQMYRPNFHFTPKNNWMNDPNGLFYADGSYHLYFQYWPYGNKWGPMHWGHATSKDLVKWEEQPIALYPDRFGYIFSGSAVLDVNNTSGFGDGKTAPVVAIFTYHDPAKEKAGTIDVESQGLAYSLDNGYTWTKYDVGNPVLKNPGIRDFRDPKVTWDTVHNQWIMVLAAQDRSQLYTSKNLKDWSYLSDFGKEIGAHGGVWECPDFFPIKVEGTGETKWVLIQSLNPGGANGGSGTQYFVGDFDGRSFVLDKAFAERLAKEKAVWLDHGKDNYAGVTWGNAPVKDGRRMMIGWMSNWEYAEVVPTNGWRSSSTIPRELKLVKKGNNYALLTSPAEALENYIEKTDRQKKVVVKGTAVLSVKDKNDFTKADISFNVQGLKQDIYTFTFTNDAGETLSFGINNKERNLFVDRSNSSNVSTFHKFTVTLSKATLGEIQKSGTFRILMDKTSIEVFYNDGETVMTEIFFTSQPLNTFSASAASPFTISDLNINQLKF